jgi:hypothetical protein
MVLWLCQVRAVVSALVLLFLLGLLLVDGGALYHCMPTRVNLLGLMPQSTLLFKASTAWVLSRWGCID